MTGAVLTGFYLIGAIGIQRSFFLGAVINCAVGVAALILSRLEPVVSEDEPAPSHGATAASSRRILRTLRRLRTLRHRSHPSAPSIGAVVLLSGLAALALEIVWFRMLVQYLEATTYAFTTMLATVLGGIASGGAVAAPLLRRDRATGRHGLR